LYLSCRHRIHINWFTLTQIALGPSRHVTCRSYRAHIPACPSSIIAIFLRKLPIWITFTLNRGDNRVLADLKTMSMCDDDRSVLCVEYPAVPCPMLPAPLHGKLGLCSQPSVYGAVCTFQCDVGYQLSDRTPTMCQLGRSGDTYWTPSAPACLRKFCWMFFQHL